MKPRPEQSDPMSSPPTPPVLVSADISSAAKPQNHTRFFLYDALFVASFNMLNSWLVAWLFFHGKAIVPVWGMGGVVFNALPSSFVPAFLITLAGTVALRGRLAKSAHHEPVPPSRWPTVSRLPAVLWRRALLIAIVSTVVTVAITIACVAVVRAVSLDYGRFMQTQMVQACILGLIVGPLVAARALMDPLRGRPDPNLG